MKVRAAIFDLDGVLFDVSERLRRCLEEVGAESIEEMDREQRRRFWRLFLSEKYMYLDRPNRELAERVRELREGGVRIIIITGRREDTQKEFTLRQLEEAGVPFDEIYFRPPGCFSKDHEFKAEVVEKLRARGYEIIEVWDDSERVAARMRELLPRARVILYKS